MTGTETGQPPALRYYIIAGGITKRGLWVVGWGFLGSRGRVAFCKSNPSREEVAGRTTHDTRMRLQGRRNASQRLSLWAYGQSVRRRGGAGTSSTHSCPLWPHPAPLCPLCASPFCRCVTSVVLVQKCPSYEVTYAYTYTYPERSENL